MPLKDLFPTLIFTAVPLSAKTEVTGMQKKRAVTTNTVNNSLIVSFLRIFFSPTLFQSIIYETGMDSLTSAAHALLLSFLITCTF
jgi:hypothetical protein